MGSNHHCHHHHLFGQQRHVRKHIPCVCHKAPPGRSYIQTHCPLCSPAAFPMVLHTAQPLGLGTAVHKKYRRNKHYACGFRMPRLRRYGAACMRVWMYNMYALAPASNTHSHTCNIPHSYHTTVDCTVICVAVRCNDSRHTMSMCGHVPQIAHCAHCTAGRQLQNPAQASEVDKPLDQNI